MSGPTRLLLGSVVLSQRMALLTRRSVASSFVSVTCSDGLLEWLLGGAILSVGEAAWSPHALAFSLEGRMGLSAS